MKDIVDTALEKNEQHQRRNNKLNIIIVVVVFLGVIIYSLIGNGGSSAAGFKFSNEGMTITDAKGSAITVTYESMKEVVFTEEAVYGEAVDGETTGVLNAKRMSGTWQSPMFGTYTACCLPKLTSAIKIVTEDAVYVVNMESNESTKALYEALLEVLEE